MTPAPRSVRLYREAAILSASPGQLVLMLFDGALRFMEAAVRGSDETDFVRRNEQIHNNVLRAQAILTELQATLNHDAGGELATTLFRLYDFMQEQLRKANMEKQPEPIRVVQRLLGEIRDGWSQMLSQPVAAQVPEKLAAAA
jgi:flagellar protein FliS